MSSQGKGIDEVAGFSEVYPSFEFGKEQASLFDEPEATFPPFELAEEDPRPRPRYVSTSPVIFGSSERISSANISDSLSMLLTSMAELSRHGASALAFFQEHVVNTPGERTIVATIHDGVSSSDIDAALFLVCDAINALNVLSRVHYTTEENLSPLADGSRSQRVEFKMLHYPSSPTSGVRRATHSPGMEAHVISAEIGSANSTPT